MGEITPKNEGNAGSHGGWLVIYYFKLFQVSNHHRDHVPLYRIFRLKRKDDQPSLPIIRCWWVVICWFKYYFKLVGGFKPFETYQIGSFPHERLKTKNWNHHPATFKVWQQFRKESPASQTHRVFGWKNSNLGSSWCCSQLRWDQHQWKTGWGSLAVLFWSLFWLISVPEETKWSSKKFSDLTHVHAVTFFLVGNSD